MYAAQYGYSHIDSINIYVDTVKLLIAEGAYVNAAISEGCRPLDYAHGIRLSKIYSVKQELLAMFIWYVL